MECVYENFSMKWNFWPTPKKCVVLLLCCMTVLSPWGERQCATKWRAGSDCCSRSWIHSGKKSTWYNAYLTISLCCRPGWGLAVARFTMQSCESTDPLYLPFLTQFQGYYDRYISRCHKAGFSPVTIGKNLFPFQLCRVCINKYWSCQVWPSALSYVPTCPQVTVILLWTKSSHHKQYLTTRNKLS